VFELSARPPEVPVDRSFVQAERLGDRTFAQAFREQQDDLLFGERQLRNRRETPFIRRPFECLRRR
jgi:hypothetical protein